MGLFGNVGHESYSQAASVQIRNVKLRDVNVRGSESVGALVGYLGTGSVSSSSVAGGSVTGVVVGTGLEAAGGQDIGGLVGSSSVPISDSSAAVSTGTTTVTFDLTGLTAGQSYEVQASFDSSFPSGSTRSYSFDTLPPGPSVSGVTVGDIMQTEATATVTVANANGSKVYLRHKSATDSNFGTAQEAAASTATVSFTLSGLTAGLAHEVQASFDVNFQSGVQATTFSTSPAASVSRVDITDIAATGAKTTVTIAYPDGGTVYLRHKAATDAAFGTPVEATADAEKVSFTLMGLTLRVTYEVQASLDQNFLPGTFVSTTFTTSMRVSRASSPPDGGRRRRQRVSG